MDNWTCKEGSEFTVEFLQKLNIDVVVDNERLKDVAQAIADAARKSETGDGKIYISDVDSVVRIRTGDRDSTALCAPLNQGNRTNSFQLRYSQSSSRQ